MKNYKKWTAEERNRNLTLYNEAKRKGLMQKPTQCRICGQTKGILHTHCTDYDVSLEMLPKLLEGRITEDEKKQLDEVLLPVCWRCHMMIHKAEKHPKSAEKYFSEIKDGVRYAPVFRGNAWGELVQHLID